MIRKVIRYNKTVAKTIPSAKMYVERFAALQTTLLQQNKRINQYSKQVELANQAQKMTIRDHINKTISKIVGSNFQSQAMRKLRQQLIFYRQDLQHKIQESDTKWQKPRQQIIKLRKQMADQFLSQFVKLQQNLLKNCSYETSPQLAQGLALIHRLLVNTITKHGVKFYEPQIGAPYDPQLYDTLDKGQKGNPIVKVASRGWKINDKIVKKPIVNLQ